MKDPGKRPPVVLSLILVLLMTGLAVIGYLSYRGYQARFRAQVEQQLSIIGRLKAAQVGTWRKERLADAEVLARNGSFNLLVRRFLEDRGDPGAKAEIERWLALFQAYRQYDRVFVIDAHGQELIASSGPPEPAAAHLLRDASAVLASGEADFLDFHRDAAGGPIHLSVLAPVPAGPLGRPLCVVVFRIDPSLYLYPFIQTWPTASATAETLLVRREGPDILFLNELKFQKDAALKLRRPLADARLPAAQAVLGHEGVVEGVDYRGRRVVADVRAVPDSPWFIVSRLDTAEAYAPMRERLWRIVLFFGILMAASSAGLGLLWRRQRLRYYMGQAAAAQALRESEERFQLANRASSDAIWDRDLKTGRLLWNDNFYKLFGYRPDEVEPGPESWSRRVHPDDWSRVDTGLHETLLSGDRSWVDHYRFRRKDGSYAEIEDRGYIIRDPDGKPTRMIGAMHDITELRRTEALIRARLGLVEFASSHDFGEVLRKALDEAGEKTGSPIGFFHFVENDQKAISLQAWSTRTVTEYCRAEGRGQHYPIDQAGVWADCVRTGQPVIHNDYAGLPHRRGLPDGHAALVRELVIPVSRGGRIVAVMGVGNKAADYSDDDAGLVAYFADVAWEIVERKRSEEELAVLHRIADIFLRAPTDEMYFEVLQVVLEDLRSPFGVFGYLDDDGSLVVPSMTRHIWERCQVPDKASVFPYDTWGHSSWPTAIREKRAVYSNEPSTKVPEGHVPVRRHISMPILYNGEAIGLLQVANKDSDYTFLDLTRLEAVARHIAPLLSGRLQRVKARESLRMLSERQQALLSAIPDIIMEVDANKVYTWANRAGTDFFGEDVIGKPAAAYFEGEQDVYRQVQPIFNGDESVIYVESLQRRKDGEKRLLAWWCRTLKDAQGSVVGALSSARDVTEQKRQENDLLAAQTELRRLLAAADRSRRVLLSVVEDQKAAETEIRKLNAELEHRVQLRTAQIAAANKELEAFSYSVSHDLRAPLRGIDGWSLALLEDFEDKLDARGRQYLGRIRSETQRMGQLIDDLLEFSRETRGEMASELVDLTALARKIASRLRQTDPARDVEFVIQPGLSARGDPRMLEVALTNLLDNAFKFSGPRPRARVEFGTAEVEGRKAFFVRDNGVGFDMAYVHKLFRVFQRLHPLSEFSGTGIGLATAERIISRHGGRIWAEAQVGAGAAFYFTLLEAA